MRLSGNTMIRLGLDVMAPATKSKDEGTFRSVDELMEICNNCPNLVQLVVILPIADLDVVSLCLSYVSRRVDGLQYVLVHPFYSRLLIQSESRMLPILRTFPQLTSLATSTRPNKDSPIRTLPDKYRDRTVVHSLAEAIWARKLETFQLNVYAPETRAQDTDEEALHWVSPLPSRTQKARPDLNPYPLTDRQTRSPIPQYRATRHA